MKFIFKRLIYRVINFLLNIHAYESEQNIRKKHNLSDTVKFANISIGGNVEIGKCTYLNDGCRLDTGNKSSIKIGEHCAIGRWVHITSKTHDLSQPTTNEVKRTIPHVERDIIIGSHVWIGDHSVINLGVKIGDHAIIGANSFVNRDVQPFEIVGGVPARHIRFNTQNDSYKN